MRIAASSHEHGYTVVSNSALDELPQAAKSGGKGIRQTVCEVCACITIHSRQGV